MILGADLLRLKALVRREPVLANTPDAVCAWLFANVLTVGQKVRVWTGRGWLDYHEGIVVTAELYPKPDDTAFPRRYAWSRRDVYAVRFDREPAYPGEPREGMLSVHGRPAEHVSWGKSKVRVYRLALVDAPQYTLDGEPIDLQEFLDANPRDDNPEVDPDDIRALAPGGVIFYGGGAAPTTILRRVR